MQRIPMILLLLFVFNLSKWAVVESQSLPPAKYDGFLYQNTKPDSDSIIIDAFFDPVCPDSRDAWPPIKQVLHHYGSRVSFVLHLLPLPYHDNAYATSRALHIANSLNASSTFPLLERFFEHQEKFYNAYTQNSARVAVVKELVKFVSVAVGDSLYHAVEAGFNDRKTDLNLQV